MDIQYFTLFGNKKIPCIICQVAKMLLENILHMKKNISLTITISPDALGRLKDMSGGYPMPTLMRMILEAASEHRGGLYTLLAKLATNNRL